MFLKSSSDLPYRVGSHKTVKNAVFWDAEPCSFVLTDVSKDHIASIFRTEESASEEPA
jgi:hypothetical protein